LYWFISFLTDRQQYLHNAGNKSGLLPVRLGFSQGSILGPSMHWTTTVLPGGLSIKLFVDDTAHMESDLDASNLKL